MRDDRFERLYAEHAHRLFAFLAYRTGDRVLAEDLLADVFERALRARKTYDPRKGSEASWLYAIALNRLRDEKRREQAQARATERFLAEPVAPLRTIEDRCAERDTVMRALKLLSPEEREVVSLRFGADLTNPQIAKVTGEPLTTVEGRLYRALRRLNKLLRAQDAVPLTSTDVDSASLGARLRAQAM
jgi:RNA polymerase sigma-70 factor (ECF subfamily)